MNFSEIWIRRPVMTTLVMVGVVLFGVLSYRLLPINNLPDVDFPTITVTARLPGASPEIMAATVATPLEKQFSSMQGLESMSSSSVMGVSTVNLQFRLERNIDSAAQDVNAAISTAVGVLPKNMPTPPTFKKVNPADMGILFLGLTSEILPASELQDFVDNRIVPALSTVAGVGDIDTAAPQKFAVRVQVDPDALAARKIGINEVADAISNGNVNLPGGVLNGATSAYTIESDGQLPNARAFDELVVAYRNGAPVRVKDIGRAMDGVEDDKLDTDIIGGGKRAKGLVLRIRKQPGYNTTETAQRVKDRLKPIVAGLTSSIKLYILWDQSTFIEESMADVQFTMVFTIFLVVAVVFLFIRSFWPTLIPSVVVPLSLVAVFPVMAALGYTLNNLSLMALTLCIGFVVDDAIVVMENIVRRMDGGETAMTASLRGSREIGFTVLSMTVSLAVVFVPIMFMSGILGRLFREFAVCITAAILLSGVFSLTLTPMLCSRFLKREGEGRKVGALGRAVEGALAGALSLYRVLLRVSLKLRPVTLVATLLVTVAAAWLFIRLPKGFIPNQDQNYFRIFTQAADRTSFQEMKRLQEAVVDILSRDPDCAAGSTAVVAGVSGENTGLMFVSLKPLGERKTPVDQVMARLRPQLSRVPGLTVSMVNPPLISIGSRLAVAQWQFTLQSQDLDALYRSGAELEKRVRGLPYVTDVKSDLQLRKPKIAIHVDREKASAHGLTLRGIQEAFYSAYGSRLASTIYTDTNFYYVILELLPEFRLSPDILKKLYVQSNRGELVPLGSVATLRETVAPQSVNHQGQIPAASIWFNLTPGQSIGEAIQGINRLAGEVLPPSVQTSFQGAAQAFQASFTSMGFLLVITVIIIYLVLGILYESFIHPLTILTSLPLAGFGALAALYFLKMELDVYAYVGMIMLVGIVKKNGIMMVDFAVEAGRTRGLDAVSAITEACLVRFRPIMMTTMAALFGALPIAVGYGAGGEARQPMGVAVVGGLLFSQVLTLFITPVFYVYMDKVNRLIERRRSGSGTGGSETAQGA